MPGWTFKFSICSVFYEPTNFLLHSVSNIYSKRPIVYGNIFDTTITNSHETKIIWKLYHATKMVIYFFLDDNFTLLYE